MPRGLPDSIWLWVAGVVAFVAMLIGSALAPARLWQRLGKVGRFLVYPLALLLAVGLFVLFLVVLPRANPPEGFDTILPVFLQERYWWWMLGFVCAAVAALVVLARTLGGRRSRSEPIEGGGLAGSFPDLDAAWDEVLVRLDSVNIDLGRQDVFLLLATEEARAAALVEAAGLQVFAQAPSVPEGPIHAYATAEGVLLSLSGASSFGTGEANGPARLADICRKVLRAQPDRPVARGVAVLFPIDWAATTESVGRSAAVRDDLRVIRQVFQLGLPVFALFPGMEAVPGFPEFIARLVEQVSPQMRDQRVGFAVPPSAPFSGDLVGRGLTWQSSWFHSWTLHLLAGRLMDHKGNAALVTLDHEFRRYRKRLRSILESAFSTHREAEPVAFRGCYFLATGAERADRAFSAGLVRGPRSRVVAEGAETSWAEEARAEDRKCRSRAWAVGLVGGGLCASVWLFIIARSPLAGGLGLGTLAVAWGVALLRPRRAETGDAAQ